MSSSDIGKIYFLVHPFCYAVPPEDCSHMTKAVFLQYREYEDEVAKRWHEAIEQMGQNDTLVLHPGPGSDPADKLMAFAEDRLGKRYIALPMRNVSSQEATNAEVLSAISSDVAGAFRERGHYWYVQDIRVAIASWHYARDLEKIFHERGMAFDPQTVLCEAWGESFVGCVSTWTTMVPEYLDVESRVEINFEMCVPDSFFLLRSRFVKRLPLSNAISLFLWEREDGEAIALFHRERIRLQDPCCFVKLPMDESKLKIVGKWYPSIEGPAENPIIWPSDKPTAVVRQSGCKVYVMVSSGRGRGPGPDYPREQQLFICTSDIEAAELGNKLVSAEILSESGIGKDS